MPATKTNDQLKALLEKHGAMKTLVYEDREAGHSYIAFEMQSGTGRVSFALHLPLPDPVRFPTTAQTTGRLDQKAQFANQYEKEKARLWRVCLALITAKLVAIQEKATTIEREFFADRLVYDENGRQVTVYDWYAPQLRQLEQTDRQPLLLPGVRLRK